MKQTCFFAVRNYESVLSTDGPEIATTLKFIEDTNHLNAREADIDIKTDHVWSIYVTKKKE